MPRRGSNRERLYRSREDRVLAGVCGGLAEHFGMASWGMRVIWIVLAFFTGLLPMIVVYFIMALAVNEAPLRSFESPEEEEFWHTFQSSRTSALQKIEQTFERLDKRLQRMESIVTQPTFDLEDEYRNL